MLIPARLINPSRALPSFTGARKPVGATRSTQSMVAPVIGSPSMRVLRDKDGGAKTLLRRNIANMDLLTDEDLKPLMMLLNNAKTNAVNLSQGGLSYQALARLHHPYGRGRINPSGNRRRGLGRLSGSGRGVSNLAVVNKHTGEYARSWYSDLARDKSGLNLILGNSDPRAAELAFGTSKMKAHGPQTTALAKVLGAIDVEVRRLGRVASARNESLNQVTAGQRMMRRAVNGGS